MPIPKGDARTRSYYIRGVDSDIDDRMFVSSGDASTQLVMTICVMPTLLNFIQQRSGQTHLISLFNHTAR